MRSILESVKTQTRNLTQNLFKKTTKALYHEKVKMRGSFIAFGGA